MFLISGKSVTVVDPAVWSGALLKALYETSVKPRKKKSPPSVTMKEAIPLLTIIHPCIHPKDSVIHNVINIASSGETSLILNNVYPSKWKPPSKDM